MKRTGAIVILAVIAVAAGIVAVFDTIRYLEFAFSPLSFLGAPWQTLASKYICKDENSTSWR